MKKKFITGCLVLNLLFSLVGCTAKETNEIHYRETESETSTPQSTLESVEAFDEDNQPDENLADTGNFFSVNDEITAILKAAEERDVALEQEAQNAMAQADMNDASMSIFQNWDDCLNEIWDVLGRTLPKADMQKLTEQQRAWIQQKDSAVKESRKGLGSIGPLVANDTAARWTKERVYVLASYGSGEARIPESYESGIYTTMEDEAVERENEITQAIQDAEIACQTLDKALKEGREMSQAEMNGISQLKYEAWDEALNTVWGILKEVLPKEDMEALTREELQWIRDKEAAAEKAVLDAGGSSMAISAYGATAEQWTKDRLEILIPIAIGKNISLSSHPEETTLDIGPDLAEILDGSGKFYCQDYGKQMSLDEYCNELSSTSDVPVTITKFSAVDMDNDHVEELLLWVTVNNQVDYGMIVLHDDGQQISGRTYACREMYHIKEDGTFWWSAGSADDGPAHLVFDKDNWHYENISPEGFDEKEDIQWHFCDGK